MPKVIQLQSKPTAIEKRPKVAAYARVSMDCERLMHSLSAQMSYYSRLIQNNPKWEFAGVYADEGITGTLVKKRDEFKRMVKDAEEGKIDIILTKSIQRFARNTVDLLETVRHLKDIGVEVRFEKENISTMSGDGELMLTIIASFAQEEVRSLSDNVRWARRKNIDAGKAPVRFKVFGYKWEGDQLTVVPEEAEVVRRIFREFLDGRPVDAIWKDLKAEGYKSWRGTPHSRRGVLYILKNPIYKGDLLLQKYYRADPITKKQKKNEGELPMVLVENDHDAIIDAETFALAEKEFERREPLNSEYQYDFRGMRMFTYKVRCKEMDEHFRHSMKCGSYDSDGLWVCYRTDCPMAEKCDHKCLPDLAIRQACKRALKMDELDGDAVKEKVDKVIIPKDGRITIQMHDGSRYDDFFRGFEESIKPQGRNTNVFSRKLVCGACGEFYKSTSYRRKGIRRVYWGCRNCKDNSYIHENVLQYRVAELVGWDGFSFERFRQEVEHIDMDRPCHMTVHFKDGRTGEAEYYSMDRSGKNAKENNEDSGYKEAVFKD